MNGIQLCKQALSERKYPGRAGFFASIKLIPALMFGVVLLGQSLYVGYFIVKNFLMLTNI